MEYVKLGRTGLDISPICIGAMGFGTAEGWVHSQWALDEDASRDVVKSALDKGINFFDTANVYAAGNSEEILGKALRALGNRDEIVLATKLHGRMHEGANGAGLSRKAVMSEVDHSLKRLGTDWIDLYIIHRFDPTTPVEETMQALDDVVRAGKVRYLGASSMWAYQFGMLQNAAERHGWTKFVSMQNHYNLLYREEEREMVPFCQQTGVALTPYSPLAAGRLTRDWTADTARSQTDVIARRKYDSTEEQDRAIVERVAAVADELGVSRAAVALAWLWAKGVAAPIIGATKESHLTSAIEGLGVELTDEQIASLEEPYVPHEIMGHN
ncbi:aldo/keto reductase [Aestuariimicrobium ganziense]|uniref:aldo/keto reductase n=1 Tax=Aestuariimicrobium ganziense TaxID=2773677 RepID=UPI001944551A|nr:aldo/keto reductase [Aestuariimicrobium ganziense]